VLNNYTSYESIRLQFLWIQWVASHHTSKSKY
jgi:hypothetical protein